MDVLRVCRWVTWTLFFLVLGTHLAVMVKWPQRAYVPPDSWQAINFLRKNSFMNLKPGEKARFLFNGELLHVEGLSLSFTHQQARVSRAIKITIDKAYLNEPVRHLQVVFAVVEEEGKPLSFPMLLMNTQTDGEV